MSTQKSAKLWGGRFKKSLDADAVRLSYSYDVDSRLYRYDIRVNQAQAKALWEVGILTESEFDQLTECLEDILVRFENSDSDLFAGDEDIHSCIERLVTQKVGDLGKKLHTGKSRNDQVICDVRLYLKEEIGHISTLLRALMHAIWTLASQNQTLIMPGLTHFQTAQPVLVAHHLLAYFEQFSRDHDRFSDVLKRVDICPLGSGALAGNNYGLDRNVVAKLLGFSTVSQNSMDAVGDRDFLLEFLSHVSITMMHLSRFAEEMVIWSSPLIGFIEIGDEFTTGSSIMPQKKNPDIAELIRGKSGRVLGNLVSLHHILKALPMTYNRDLQEDKEGLFDSIDTVSISLKCFAKMLGSITFNSQALTAAVKKGYTLATELADYLAKKGVPFRQAHEITGQVVLYAVDQKKQLEELTLGELTVFSDAIDQDINQIFNYEKSLERKDVLGGTAPNQVRYQLQKLKEQYKW